MHALHVVDEIVSPRKAVTMNSPLAPCRPRRARTFSLVMAGVNCLSVPLGTTLGVFTFIVLLRESVAAQYALARRDSPHGV